MLVHRRLRSCCSCWRACRPACWPTCDALMSARALPFSAPC